ncbi:MAG TPA: putative 2OG-Fe(II) oxygenase [Pseudoxanthomonas sp.]|nr:putative 2OG-Fe(II) oxygenase [Pseudoxanthomonas sp.]
MAIQAGHAVQAIQILSEALAQLPMNAELYFLRGMAHSSMGQSRTAVFDFDMSLHCRPDTLPVLFNRAVVLYSLDRADEALSDFIRITELEPGSVEAWTNAGVIYLRREEYSLAARYLRRANHLGPDQPQTMRSLANALRGCGEAQESLELHQRVIALTPRDPAALTDYALCLLTFGHVAEAQSRYLSALSISPGDQTALAGLYMTANALRDSERVHNLMDYRRLLGHTHVQADVLDTEALRSDVLRHPDLIWEPAGRSTRRGQQSTMLDLSPASPFAGFNQVMTETVHSYVESVCADSTLRTHPWIMARPSQWRIQAWATVLHEGGQQTPHIHPAGWLSGVFYVDAGDAPGQDDGTLIFGHMQPGLALSAPLHEHRHKPATADLLCFPSYFFHHTLPYHGSRPRISLAFDVMPLTR